MAAFFKSFSAVQWVLLVLEVLLIVWFAIAFPFLNMGNLFGGGVCLLAMAMTLRWDWFAKHIKSLGGSAAGKGVLICGGVVLAVAVIYIIILNVMMFRAMANKPDKPNAVVVLGCQVRGTSPSKMLRRRLDAAKQLLDEYPDVKCVVSGGQGSDEQISEAECMRDYLVENGISADRIIMEDKSTTTFENLKFSLEKLDEQGIDRDITIVTDGYHMYRACLIAKQEGAGEVTSCCADTEFRMIATYWVREWFGLTKFILFGR